MRCGLVVYNIKSVWNFRVFFFVIYDLNFIDVVFIVRIIVVNLFVLIMLI